LEGVNVLVLVFVFVLVWVLVYVLGLRYPVSVVLSGLLTLPTSENVAEVVVIPPRVGGESKEDIELVPLPLPVGVVPLL
jgi:hypothetical protein